jgi:hypothetical protein
VLQLPQQALQQQLQAPQQRGPLLEQRLAPQLMIVLTSV